MGDRVTLRQLRNFTDPTNAKSAAELTRQIADFEDNVAAETASIRDEFMLELKPKSTSTRTNGVIVAPGEYLGVDTTSSDLLVVLEKPSAQNAGRFAGITKRVAVNTMNVVVEGGALINGATPYAATAVGLYPFLSDGEAYWI
jgi:hypothetical protein